MAGGFGRALDAIRDAAAAVHRRIVGRWASLPGAERRRVPDHRRAGVQTLRARLDIVDAGYARDP